MRKTLVFLHLLGFAIFLGSIPGHIVLGQLAGSADSLSGLPILQQAKHASILALTLPGLMLYGERNRPTVEQTRTASHWLDAPQARARPAGGPQWRNDALTARGRVRGAGRRRSRLRPGAACALRPRGA
jgi:hypothetical protein